MTLYILFEHAAGYALFNAEGPELEESEIKKSVYDVGTFQSICSFKTFQPFRTGRDALENINCVSEGLLHSHLEEFLDGNLPTKKRKKITLGVCEPKLAVAISEKLELNCISSSVIAELHRGIRHYFPKLVEGFGESNAVNKAQLGLGHSYSRARVKFNVNKIDNMIIQSINLVDQLDKDINNFTMRIREWYSHHFPELIKVVPENTLYIPCVKAIRDRKNLPEGVEEELESILNDPVKVQNVLELARSSMGMDISEVDLGNVYDFAERVISLTKKRKEMMDYLRSKMHNVAPNLAALIGDVVGARLISHAGSLVNLAKSPASTVQILGAEKALFRALKTRGNTPKYGLLFHSKFIGKAAKSNKGRISRYLANKCSVASRIDCFRDIPTDVFGGKLKQQVESRLKFYETGELPEKNIDVMDCALEEAEVAQVAILKQMKKAKKKAKKEKDMSANDTFLSTELSFMSNDSQLGITPNEGDVKEKKKKKKRKHTEIEQEESFAVEHQEVAVNGDVESPKKKKKRLALEAEASEVGDELNGIPNGDMTVSAKKKKKKKTHDAEGLTV